MLNTNYLHRHCPICNQDTNSGISISSPNRAEDYAYEDLVPYWNGFFKEKIFFSYVECETCKLLYAPIFYTDEQLSKLYSQMPPNMDIVPMDALIRTQTGYLEPLKNQKLNGDFLEVGPDIGIFSGLCSKKGWFRKFWLFEPNVSVKDALAKSVSTSAEYSIIEEMFNFSMVPNHCVGLVVMIQVLDHLLDPVSTLRELHGKMLPGAKLLLVTHNEKSLLRRLVGWKWPAFCLQHPQIYSPSSITALLTKSGYKVESINRTKNYFEMGFLIKHLFWILGININRMPNILNFKIGLRLGNIITIASPSN